MTTLQSILDDAVAAGHAPGMIAAAITPSGETLTAAAGVRAVGSSQVMTPDTVCWIASCTKAITSVAAMQLVERGLIDLDAPVGRHLPLLAAPQILVGFDAADKPITRPATTPITLRHLLTHTSGLAYGFFSADLTRYLSVTGQTMPVAAAPDIPLLFEPGTGWQYGIGTDWVGQLVEAISGQGLDAYVAANILAPLGMSDTGFFPPGGQSHRRAALHTRREGGGFDLASFPIPTTPYPAMGGGGLYSTVGDYLTFLTAIMGGGQAPGGARILKPETVAMMGANHTGDLEAGNLTSALSYLTLDFSPLPGVAKRFGLGFLRNEAAVPGGRSAGSLAWAGLANCYYWADPASGVAGVLFSQLFPFADTKVLETFAAVEQSVYAA